MDDPVIKPQSPNKELFEVIVFLLLIVPSMVISFLAVGKEKIGFPVLAVSVISRDIALTCLVVFFLWRDGEPLARLGWEFSKLKQEALLGLVLFVPIMYLEAVTERLFQWLGLSSTMGHLPSFLTAKGPWEFVLASLLVAVVAVAEETIFRGYLILRFKNLGGGVVAAVLISSVIFAMGHGYEGSASVGTVGVLGVALALIYVWRKSLIAPVVLHFLIDFFPLVLLPLLKIK